MGNDGLAAVPVNAKVGRDAFSYSLNYFAGDYAAIEATKWSSVANRFEAGRTNSYLFNARNDLYNGNISAMVTNMAQPKLYTSAANEQPTLQPQGMAYKYDQLNRIKNANAYTNLNTTNNEWETTGGVPANYYRNTFTYDGNGNILNQTRYAQTTLIDDLSYKYTRDVNQKLLRNQLNYVTDAVVGSTPTDDIESQSLGNYKYDELGNLRKDSIEQIETIEWNVYGKIKKIKRYLTSTKSNLEFVYDASGNRIAKIEKPDGTSIENGAASDQVGNWKITYYVRDATGNVMGNYYQTNVSGLPSHKLIEHPIYGSSRLGSDNTQQEMIAAVIPSPFTRTIGNKYFEGVNHLGNVLSVYTDKKIPRDDNSDGTVDYYQAEVVSCSDYTPFGAPMNERTFSSNKYRYGFNGQEKDDEVSGQGNSYTAEFWQYDSRLGRRWNSDPIVKPWMSPYHAFSNKPILNIDPNGASDSPVYDQEGNFMGTDDQGLEGKAIVMKKDDFNQGMKHEDAMKKDLAPNGHDEFYKAIPNSENYKKFYEHFENLPSRPDYGGFVTIDEGIAWARSHPGALQNPTPENTLYLDASKLDFGNITTADFRNGVGTSSPINLNTAGNFATAQTNARLAATVYALGRVDINLLTPNGSVSIVNNDATDYDWNRGGSLVRSSLINIERVRASVDDTHGFKTFYYGIGHLRR